MDIKNLGENLQRLMTEQGVSQSGLARATGVPQPTINRILNSATKEPRHNTLLAIANFFKVTIDELYGLVAEQETTSQSDRIIQLIKSLRPNERQRLIEEINKHNTLGLYDK